MSDETEDAGEYVTEAEMAAARKFWADPEHEPAAPERFSRAVVGDGFRGDVPIGREDEDDAD